MKTFRRKEKICDKTMQRNNIYVSKIEVNYKHAIKTNQQLQGTIQMKSCISKLICYFLETICDKKGQGNL